MERPAGATVLIAVLVALILGGVVGFLIGRNRLRADEARITHLEKKEADIPSRSRERTSASPGVVAPRNPNTAGGTFNPAQPQNSAGGGVAPSEGKTESVPAQAVPTSSQH